MMNISNCWSFQSILTQNYFNEYIVIKMKIYFIWKVGNSVVNFIFEWVWKRRHFDVFKSVHSFKWNKMFCQYFLQNKLFYDFNSVCIIHTCRWNKMNWCVIDSFLLSQIHRRISREWKISIRFFQLSFQLNNSMYLRN